MSVVVVNVVTIAADLQAGAAGIGLLAGVGSRWLVLPMALARAGLLLAGWYGQAVAGLTGPAIGGRGLMPTSPRSAGSAISPASAPCQPSGPGRAQPGGMAEVPTASSGPTILARPAGCVSFPRCHQSRRFHEKRVTSTTPAIT